jgi:hypothetical protein
MLRQASKQGGGNMTVIAVLTVGDASSVGNAHGCVPDLPPKRERTAETRTALVPSC